MRISTHSLVRKPALQPNPSRFRKTEKYALPTKYQKRRAIFTPTTRCHSYSEKNHGNLEKMRDQFVSQAERFGSAIRGMLPTGLSADEFSLLSSSLPGTYSIRTVVTTNDKIAGMSAKSVFVTYGIAEIFLEDQQFWVREHFLTAESITGFPIDIQFPDESVQMTSKEPVPLRVAIINGKAHIHRPFVKIPVGYEVEDNDFTLPTSLKDERLICRSKKDCGIPFKFSIPPLPHSKWLCVRNEEFEYGLGVSHETDEGQTLIGTTIDLGTQEILQGIKKKLDSEQDEDLKLSTVVFLPLKFSDSKNNLLQDLMNEPTRLKPMFASYPLPKIKD